MTNKSEIVDDFRSKVQKQNPWQPYQGDAGGEGWQNLITGEIRYQDQRPEPEEGVPDDHEGDIPTPEGEVPDALEEEEPDVIPHLEEGMEIEVEDIGDGTLDAEVIDTFESSHGPSITIEDENGDEYSLASEGEIASHPMELEPEQGWADGWAEPPDDHDDLSSGQTIEIYDTEEGVYKEGEVEKVDEWSEGTYVSVRTEDNDIYEFLDGEPTGSGEGALMTAAEDLVHPDLRIMEPGDFDYDMNGEDVAIYNDHTGQVEQGQVTNVSPDLNEVLVETEDDESFAVGVDTTWSLVSEEGEKEIELHNAPKIDDPDLEPEDFVELADLHEGALAEVEHPAEGSVIGEVDVRDHGEKGRHLYVGDSEVGIPLDDPEHPLAQGVEIGEVEQQWVPLEETEAEGPSEEIDELMEDMGLGTPQREVQLGDQVKFGDDTYRVTAVDPATGELELDGGKVTWSQSEAQSLAEYVKPMELPEGLTTDEGWDSALPDSFKTEDMVAYFDEETGELFAAEVQMDEGDEVTTADQGTIPTDKIRAWADTGKPVAHQTDPGTIQSGAVATIAHDYGDEVNTFDAYVTEAKVGYGVPTATVMTEDGKTQYIELDEHEYGLVEVDEFGNAEDVIDSANDWQERSTEELVDEFYQKVPTHQSGNYLAKLFREGMTPDVRLFFKSEQESIKTEFMTSFPPDQVEQFYEAISDWKMSSSRTTREKKMLEEAFRQAMSSEARVGGEDERHPAGPVPPAEWQKMAEVAHEMSKRYWEDVVSHNTGGRLTRDCSSTSFRSFLNEWAENPDADSFDFDGRALNNFQINPGTWNYWRVTPSDVPSESVGLMTDMMFNPMETNSNEDEIWVNPDALELAPDEVGVGADRTDLSSDGHFGGDIEEWSDNQVRTVSQEIAQHYDDLTVDESEVYRPDNLSDQQVETFLRVAERAEEVGMTGGSVNSWADLVEAEAIERGITAPEGGTEHPVLDSADQLPVDTEVTVREETGEEIEGVVVGHEDGMMEVENTVTGNVGMFDLSDLDEVVWAGDRYGKPAQVDMSDFDVSEFEPLDEVFVWSGGDWVEGKILESDDGTVEVSLEDEYGSNEYFDEFDIQEENYVVPQDMVDAASEEYPDPGTTVEVQVPDSIDYDATSVMAEVDSVDANGSLNIHHSEIPWIEHDGNDAMGETVNVDPEHYTEPSEGSVDTSDIVQEYDGAFSEGTTVPVDADHNVPNEEVTIGDRVNIWDDAEGVVVDVTHGNDPKVHITDAGSETFHEEGDVETIYPSDGLEPANEPEDFGAITNGFDSVDLANAYTGDTVEYLDPETGEVKEGEMTATFESIDAVHIDGVEDPVHYEQVRPTEEVDDMVTHEDVSTGTNVVVEHFDPAVGTQEGTIIGWDQTKNEYIVDLSYEDEEPVGDKLLYAGTNEIQDVKGQGEADDAAVQLVSDSEGFTSDTPGASDPSDTAGVDPDSLSSGQEVVFQTQYDDSPVHGVVDDVYGNDSVSIDSVSDASYSNYTVSPADIFGTEDDGPYPAELDALEPGDELGEGMYVVENPDDNTLVVEGVDMPESVVDYEDIDSIDPDDTVTHHDLEEGDVITYESYGNESEVKVLDPWLPGDAVEVETEDGDILTVYDSEITGTVEGSDTFGDAAFEVGQDVTVALEDPDAPGGEKVESGQITETMTIGNEEFFVVDDKEGVRIGEYTGEELEELTEGTVDDPQETGEEFSHIPPEEVFDAGVEEGDEFTTQIPGEGEMEVEVDLVSADPAYPIEVVGANGDRYAIYDDGQVSPL